MFRKLNMTVAATFQTYEIGLLKVKDDDNAMEPT